MKYIVKLTPEAKSHLHDAVRWYAAQDKAVAMEWFEGFLAKLESLSENPEQFGFARENDQSPYELRTLLYGSGKRLTHRAVFRIIENYVEVLAVRHLARQDFDSNDL